MTNHIKMQLVAVKDLLKTEPLARLHSRAKLRKLQHHMRRFGPLAPVLVDGKYCVIDGHARLAAAKALGLEHINVIVIDHLTDDEVRSLRLSLNRLQQEVQWDPETVRAELQHLVDIKFDLDLTAFDTVEIEDFLEIGSGTPADVEDLDAKLLAGPLVTRKADTWLLRGGTLEHKIACRDSLDASLVQRISEGRQAAACFTDPPYNLRVSGVVSGTGKHGEFAMASGEMSRVEFKAFLVTMFTMIEMVLAPQGVVFTCIDWRGVDTIINASQELQPPLELINLAVWTKTNAGQGSFLRSQHELIPIFKRAGEPFRNNIQLGRHGRSRSNVWNYRGVNVHGPERSLLDDHPTIKPSALVADAIRDVTLPGERVFDPFLGSGTTLIACQRTGRNCIGIEIDPKYVDLAIRRWQAETGRTPVRESDGLSFAEAEEAAQKALSLDGGEDQ